MSKNNEELLIAIWFAASEYRIAQDLPEYASANGGLSFFAESLDLAIQNYEESE